MARDGLDAVIINASGCGTTVKDYGFMFRADETLAEEAERISTITRDITEYLAEIGLPDITHPVPKKVAYHSACSMQHGQRITHLPKELLIQAGFEVVSPAEGHLCCGSAGTYNIMQPEIAETIEGTQGCQYRKDRCRSDRRRQYRLHHPDRRWHGPAHRPYSGIIGLGDGGEETERPLAFFSAAQSRPDSLMPLRPRLLERSDPPVGSRHQHCQGHPPCPGWPAAVQNQPRPCHCAAACLWPDYPPGI